MVCRKLAITQERLLLPRVLTPAKRINRSGGSVPPTSTVKSTSTKPTSTVPVTSAVKPTSTTTSKVSTTSVSVPTVGTIPKYGQCGGEGWTGTGSCAAGSTCQVSNQWYSQCL